MKQKKVLIAEENGEFLKNMLASFRSFGFECISVPKNGEETVAAIEKYHYDWWNG